MENLTPALMPEASEYGYIESRAPHLRWGNTPEESAANQSAFNAAMANFYAANPQFGKKAKMMDEATLARINSYWAEIEARPVSAAPKEVFFSPGELKAKFFRTVMTELRGKAFSNDPHTLDVYKKVFAYFCDPTEAIRLGLDLRKGLWICGATGLGKSLVIRAMAEFMAGMPKEWSDRRKIGIIDVAVSFAESANKREEAMVKMIRNKSEICLDDIGSETEVAKSYGTSATEYVSSLLKARYNLLTAGVITHVTSNIEFVSDGNGVASVYGERIASRCNEMFNLIYWNSSSGDKRKA